MTQTITKDGKVYCVTSIPYPPEVIKQMKKAGYKVKEEACPDYNVSSAGAGSLSLSPRRSWQRSSR